MKSLAFNPKELTLHADYYHQGLNSLKARTLIAPPLA